MSRAIQKQGMPSGLFSSALFCLWLSTASLMVWVDFGSHPSQQTASRERPAALAASTDAIKHH
jgi:hypothetical protein